MIVQVLFDLLNLVEIDVRATPIPPIPHCPRAFGVYFLQDKVNASYKEPYAVVVFWVHQQIFLLDGALRNSDQSKNAEMYRRQLQQRVGRLPTVLQRA